MKLPLPLYARISGWFLLNILILAAGVYLLVRTRLAESLDWLITREAKSRIQAMTAALQGELQESRDWESTLKRFGQAYGMELSVWANDGSRLAGRPESLPEKVLNRLKEESPQPRRRQPPPPRPIEADLFGSPFPGLDDQPPGPLSPDRSPGFALGGMPSPEQYRVELITDRDAVGYWMLVRAPFLRGSPNDTRTTMIGYTPSLASGRLLLDPVPMLLAAGGILGFCLLFWLPFTLNLTRAISRLTKATERIAEGEFRVAVDEQRGDELGRLGGAINRMGQRLDQFVTGQKRFLGDIAHELCSPLARMEMGMAVVEQRMPESLRGAVRDVQDEVREMRELVNEVLSFSKAGLRGVECHLEPVSLADVVEGVVQRESAGLGEVEVKIPRTLDVQASRPLLARAVGNILRNAARYAAGQAVSITATTSDDAVTLAIADQGPGVPAEALPRLFEAFYRPDQARDRATGGVGLGLAIVKTCIEACGGHVEARPVVPHGLEIVMRLRPATGSAHVTRRNSPVEALS